MREIEASLEIQYPIFRRIWVQYSHKGNYHVCLTLFPCDNSRYQMVFGQLNELSLDKLSNLLKQSHGV